MRHPVEGVTKMNALTLAALGTGFTFLMTAAGAAVVFLFKNEIKPSFQRVLLGFARRRDDRGQCVEPADPLH